MIFGSVTISRLVLCDKAQRRDGKKLKREIYYNNYYDQFRIYSGDERRCGLPFRRFQALILRWIEFAGELLSCVPVCFLFFIYFSWKKTMMKKEQDMF